MRSRSPVDIIVVRLRDCAARLRRRSGSSLRVRLLPCRAFGGFAVGTAVPSDASGFLPFRLFRWAGGLRLDRPAGGRRRRRRLLPAAARGASRKVSGSWNAAESRVPPGQFQLNCVGMKGATNGSCAPLRPAFGVPEASRRARKTPLGRRLRASVAGRMRTSGELPISESAFVRSAPRRWSPLARGGRAVAGDAPLDTSVRCRSGAKDPAGRQRGR